MTDGEPKKKPEYVSWVLVAIGIIAVIIIVWYMFFRNPCKEGQKYDEEKKLCVSVCPDGFSWDEEKKVCVEEDDDDGDNLPPDLNGTGDGVTPSILQTPFFDWNRKSGEYPRDVEFIFDDEGFDPAYQLDAIAGTVKMHGEPAFLAPDRLDLYKMDANGNWIYLDGWDMWGVHGERIQHVDMGLGRATIKGFKFHMRWGYIKSINVSTI